MHDGSGGINGSVALERVEKEGEGAKTLGAGADDVGGADVAASNGADVLLEEGADQDEAEGDGAEQVGENADENQCGHGAWEFGSPVGSECTAEGVLCTSPVGAAAGRVDFSR